MTITQGAGTIWTKNWKDPILADHIILYATWVTIQTDSGSTTIPTARVRWIDWDQPEDTDG